MRITTITRSSGDGSFRIAEGDRSRFNRHAAPEAVAAALADAQRRLRTAEADVAWLLRLRDIRARQVEVGEWPPAREEAP